VLHTTYSPDLASPSRRFPFPKLKTTLKGRRFQTIEDMQENAIRELRQHIKFFPGIIPTTEEKLGTVYRQLRELL
jgi:hypothetical protein